jgi:hypothetical protein
LSSNPDQESARIKAHPVVDDNSGMIKEFDGKGETMSLSIAFIEKTMRENFTGTTSWRIAPDERESAN